MNGLNAYSLVLLSDTLALSSWIRNFQAARYLEIQGLEDRACRAVADVIEGKTPEEIRATFNIKKDMTPEEDEVAVRELHAWQRATSSSENMELTPEEARRDWMDVVNSKFCTYYLLDF